MLTALAVLVLGAVVMASPASAHHPLVSGRAECNAATGKYDLRWTVAADADRGKVWSLTAVSRAVGISVPTATQPDQLPFTGQESLDPGAGTVTLSVTAEWHDTGNPGAGRVTASRSGSVTIPATPCDDDSKKIDYCHWDNGNLRNVSNGSISGLVNGHMGHAQDIWPAFTYQGQSYAAQGNQGWLGSGCSNKVPVPDQPATTDPCGPNNATWNVPADTTTIDWTLRPDGHLVATAINGNTFTDGSTTHDYVTAVDSGKRCVVPVPSPPSVHDPCGPNNATWNVPADTTTIDWTLRPDGHLVAETIGDHEFADGSTSHDYGVARDSGTKCEVPVPAKPSPNDPCGLDNATWVKPADTASVTWAVVDGDLVASTTAGYVFPGGETSHNFGKAQDSGARCEVPVPAKPSPADPCGLDNATWVKPADTASVTWAVVDGDLVASTTAGYVFPGGETSHNFGEAQDSGTPCQIPVPPVPAPNDPCGLDNATWIVPEDSVSVTWEIADGDLIATATSDYRFDDGKGTHNYGPAPDSGVKCETPAPVKPQLNDPCGPGNATWVVPADTDEVTWQIVGGELIASTTADYEFPDGSTSHSYGPPVDSGAPCLDAIAMVSTSAPTCTTGETLNLGSNILNATWGAPTRTEGPGGYSVTATALAGHAFPPDGKATQTFTGTLAGPLSADDPACIQTIEAIPSVTMDDRCGTADDSGPIFVAENDHWTAGVIGHTVVFTAKTGWRFRDGPMVSQSGKVWTEPFTPNSSDECLDAVAEVKVTPADCTSPETLVLSDGDGLVNASWGVPTLTEGPGDYSVTATAIGGHGFADGSTTRTFTGTLAGPWDGEVYFENCAPEQPAPETRQVDMGTESCTLGGVQTWSDEYTTEYVWNLGLKEWVLGEVTGPVRVDEEFTPYPLVQFEKLCPPDVAGEEPPKNEPESGPDVKGVQTTVPTVVDAGVGSAAPSADRRLPLSLVAIGGGLALMGAAGWRRRATANR